MAMKLMGRAAILERSLLAADPPEAASHGAVLDMLTFEHAVLKIILVSVT